MKGREQSLGVNYGVIIEVEAHNKLIVELVLVCLEGSEQLRLRVTILALKYISTLNFINLQRNTRNFRHFFSNCTVQAVSVR